jgi:hypothetical protein
MKMIVGRDIFESMVRSAVDQVWHECMRHGDWYSLYLYYRPGSLIFACELPNGYELVCGERMPTNITKDQLYKWVYDLTKGIPCLPLDVEKW